MRKHRACGLHQTHDAVAAPQLAGLTGFPKHGVGTPCFMLSLLRSYSVADATTAYSLGREPQVNAARRRQQAAERRQIASGNVVPMGCTKRITLSLLRSWLGERVAQNMGFTPHALCFRCSAAIQSRMRRQHIAWGVSPRLLPPHTPHQAAERRQIARGNTVHVDCTKRMTLSLLRSYSAAERRQITCITVSRTSSG
ncbi:hypothetical protein Pla52n_16020 [Stieleria varia]|uniref:Uncharacterized protein n=1 Tax=Stieleria varia TaxID=2528005 RepID=A0A5C6B221_9BACT|nr:hypothetical protein Pla52n_16020 [Stieleria varia]